MYPSNIHLLLIDPQNDFCDFSEAWFPPNPLLSGTVLKPALPVPGAHGDMLRVAELINRMGGNLREVHVTLDSHNPVDIAHACWWVNAKGEAPAPFTVISVEDVQSGRWMARSHEMQEHSLRYVKALAANGRYQLIIWPEHCLIGSWGHNVHGTVANSLNRWARNSLKAVNYVTKGSNAQTEHYSAIQAEVPDPIDSTTTLNEPLIAALAKADQILIAGEALSHCVASTVRDLADNLGEDGIKKMVLLTDCSSSVAGFNELGERFIKDMVRKGMRVATSSTFSG